MKILIDGIDYSGKTTVAKKLKQYIDSQYEENCIYYHNPRGRSDYSKEFYESIKLESNNNIKTAKIVLSHANNQKEVDRLAESSHIVVDRSIFSLYAYQMRHLSEEEMYNFLYHQFSFNHFQFDAAISLVTDDDHIIERAKDRKDSLDDYFINNIQQIRNVFVKHFETSYIIDSPVKVCYDTSGKDEQTVFEDIKEIVRV